MRWLERLGFAFLGVVLAFGAFVATGQCTLGGDILANIAGATIGGFISVGLALTMFNRERHEAAAEAAKRVKSDRAEAIRESLRYVRGIRDVAESMRNITINNSELLSRQMVKSVEKTRRALEDVTATDFHLRLAMEEAAEVGHNLAQSLPAQVNAAGMAEANQPLPNADATCTTAVEQLNKLIADYTRVRALPAI